MKSKVEPGSITVPGKSIPNSPMCCNQVAHRTQDNLHQHFWDSGHKKKKAHGVYQMRDRFLAAAVDVSLTKPAATLPSPPPHPPAPDGTLRGTSP